MNLRKSNLVLTCGVLVVAVTTPASAHARWHVHDSSHNTTQLALSTAPSGGSLCADRLDGESGFYLAVDVENGQNPQTLPVPDAGYAPVAYDVFRAPSGSTFGLQLPSTVVYSDALGVTNPAPLVTTFTTAPRTRTLAATPVDGGDPAESGDFVLTLAGFSEELPGVQAGDELLVRLSDSIGVPISATAVSCERVAPATALAGGPANGSWWLSRSVAFGLGSSEAGSTYRCTLDGRAVACDAPSFSVGGLLRTTHEFTAVARDATWNLDPTPARRVWTVPLGTLALRHGVRWQRRSSAEAYQGTYLVAKKRGALLTRQVTGVRRLALVASRGRGHGTVKVYLGSTLLRTIRLAAPSLRTKRVLPIATFPSARTGTVRVVVFSRGKQVRVEGLGVATR